MRDLKKDLQYFENYIKTELERINQFIYWIDSGRTPLERIKYVKSTITEIKIGLIFAIYSSGKSYEVLYKNIIDSISWISHNWNGFWKLKNSKGQELNQYILSAYDEMLWMLSLGFLLDIPNEEFQKLVNVIDKDGVKDNLFEFIIRAKLPNRKPIEKESYQEFFGVPKVFEKLRLAIKETDKTKAEMLIKEFITKEWYKNHKDAGWYNSHKSKHNTYFGYWSFETAAVVAIMDLDDSSFKDCEYYPKDLVDYYRKNHSAT